MIMISRRLAEYVLDDPQNNNKLDARHMIMASADGTNLKTIHTHYVKRLARITDTTIIRFCRTIFLETL